MATKSENRTPNVFLLSISCIDTALAILKERQCYGRIKEELPSIRQELRDSGKYSNEEIEMICYRLENIAGIR